jgi:hypothetical protein
MDDKIEEDPLIASILRLIQNLDDRIEKTEEQRRLVEAGK